MVQMDALLNQVSYTNRKRVKEDLAKLLSNIRTLLPKVGNLIHNDGSESKLVLLSGTIPIYYHGAQYNIPVEIYVLERYPEDPPRSFVRPTANMTIKANHNHVNMNGLVFMPYLHEWNAQSNLADLVAIMSSIFSAEPPLFSSPPKASPVTTHSNAAPVGNTSGRSTNSSITVASLATAGDTAAAVVHGTIVNAETTDTPMASATVMNNWEKPASNPWNSTTSSTTNDQNHPKVSSLRNELSSRLYQELQMLHMHLRDELDTEFINSEYLEKSAQAARENVADLTRVTADMREKITNIEAKSAELDTWMSEEEQKQSGNIEQRFQCYDDLSQQIIRLQAEYNAIDDAYYYLERALVSSQNETVDLKTFLKESRSLAYRQFQVRAHLMKINSALAQREAEYSFQNAARQRNNSNNQPLQHQSSANFAGPTPGLPALNSYLQQLQSNRAPASQTPNAGSSYPVI